MTGGCGTGPWGVCRVGIIGLRPCSKDAVGDPPFGGAVLTTLALHHTARRLRSPHLGAAERPQHGPHHEFQRSPPRRVGRSNGFCLFRLREQVPGEVSPQLSTGRRSLKGQRWHPSAAFWQKHRSSLEDRQLRRLTTFARCVAIDLARSVHLDPRQVVRSVRDATLVVLTQTEFPLDSD